MSFALIASKLLGELEVEFLLYMHLDLLFEVVEVCL